MNDQFVLQPAYLVTIFYQVRGFRLYDTGPGRSIPAVVFQKTCFRVRNDNVIPTVYLYCSAKLYGRLVPVESFSWHMCGTDGSLSGKLYG